jgi:integrase
MKVRLMHVHKVKKRLADGSTRVYHYAWRGGPRINAEPGTRAFLAEYARLTHGRPGAVKTGTLAEVVADFIASPEYTGLKPRTRADYDDNLEHVLKAFADLPIAALTETGVRKVFKDWHSSMRETPRRADMRLLALSRVLSFAVDNEIIGENKAAGIGKLYKSGTRTDIIWTAQDIEAFMAANPPHMRLALMLGLWTGQRIGDLLRLTWANYDGQTITLRQGKSGRRVRLRVAPLLKAMLDATPRTAVQIMTTEDGLPWRSGFAASWNKAKRRAGITGKRFHDLRGTFVTVAYSAGFTLQEISGATGHSEKDAERILRQNYLSADVVSSEAYQRASESNGGGTKL